MAPLTDVDPSDGGVRPDAVRWPRGGVGGGMSAAADAPDRSGPASGDAVSGELTAVLAWLGQLAGSRDGAAGAVPDATRIDRIALLERIKAAAGAAQAAEMVAFGRSQVAAQEKLVGRDLDPRAVGRGIGEQIALACSVSPFEGSRRLRVARTLGAELPGVFALLRSGEVSEYVAGLVVTETRHLDADPRRAVDEQLVAAGIARMAPRQAAATARRLAYEADRPGFVARGRTARKDRRVSIRPAPDTMTLLTGFLPVEQGVACWAALTKHTDAVIGGGDGRTRDQIMADTLVERVTGQAAAADVNADVEILVPVEALLDPESARTAEVVGYGPLPGPLVRDILAGSGGRHRWRRFFTAPAGGPAEERLVPRSDHTTDCPDGQPGRTDGGLGGTDGGRSGPIVGGDPRRRRFDGWLADLIGVRDGGRCRDPFCDAPIRHIDHIRRHRDGGPTTLANGRGVCARGNYVREMPGWKAEVVHDGWHGPPHTVRITTPTGHTYDSQAPRPP